MKNKKIKVVYVEPADYFPEHIRRELKLGEFAEPKQNKEKPTADDKVEWCGGIKQPDIMPMLEEDKS